MLESFAAEIRQDRELLAQSTERLELSLESLKNALDPDKRKELDKEDLDQVMDMALGYVNFTPSVATSFEVRQTGGSGTRPSYSASSPSTNAPTPKYRSGMTSTANTSWKPCFRLWVKTVQPLTAKSRPIRPRLPRSIRSPGT